jgi:hypothetical protein
MAVAYGELAVVQTQNSELKAQNHSSKVKTAPLKILPTVLSL